MNRNQRIKEKLKNGFNCAQIVAVVFSDKVNKDEKTILAATAGFGAGIGRQAMTCGALSGAVVIIGLAKGQTEANDKIAKEATYASVRDLFSQFNKVHGSSSCKELLGCDISTTEGFAIHSKGCNTEKCESFIKTSIEILSKILEDN
jgi:C_GCAxxG_C_C family probable redox protein